MAEKKQYKFYLTEEEFEKADNLAKKYNLTVTKLAKFFLLNMGVPKTAAEIEKRNQLKEVKNEIKQIGVNLNQIAKRVNARYYYEKNTSHHSFISNEELFQLLTETKNELNKLNERWK
ncbi:plasmid mobilization relaxosome protein MobC [Caldifermentibacillus hisashii]|uniref:plasmid mobilization protein n=1 Tax=Caldifermentibacillus hisashii TaxID=996558 RepID=UPI003135F688